MLGSLLFHDMMPLLPVGAPNLSFGLRPNQPTQSKLLYLKSLFARLWAPFFPYLCIYIYIIYVHAHVPEQFQLSNLNLRIVSKFTKTVKQNSIHVNQASTGNISLYMFKKYYMYIIDNPKISYQFYPSISPLYSHKCLVLHSHGLLKIGYLKSDSLS